MCATVFLLTLNSFRPMDPWVLFKEPTFNQSNHPRNRLVPGLIQDLEDSFLPPFLNQLGLFAGLTWWPGNETERKGGRRILQKDRVANSQPNSSVGPPNRSDWLAEYSGSLRRNAIGP